MCRINILYLIYLKIPMKESYFSLGLMSGTSMDGVDASIISSNGKDKYHSIYDEFYEYDKEIREELNLCREKINTKEDIFKFKSDLNSLEKKLTFFHAKITNEILNKKKKEIDLIGFHGQTMFHDGDNKTSFQIGDGNLLSQLTKKKVVYDFRKNDLNNGGQGAPLAPIFHKLLSKFTEKNIVSFLNIGGISNETIINDSGKMSAKDVGPGNCLIDKWIRLNTKDLYDNKGEIAKSGKVDHIILENNIDFFLNSKISKKKSLDIHDFDYSFVRGLSLNDGAATLTEFTAEIISKNILNKNIYVCGGGRKNKFLIKRIEEKIRNKINMIEDLNLNGDFIESQAFAYLAIRSILSLPISFPETTGCSIPTIGGVIVKNF